MRKLSVLDVDPIKKIVCVRTSRSVDGQHTSKTLDFPLTSLPQT